MLKDGRAVLFAVRAGPGFENIPTKRRALAQGRRKDDYERCGDDGSRGKSLVRHNWRSVITAFIRERNPLNFLPSRSSIPVEQHVPADTQQLYEQTLVIRSQLGDEAAFRELLALHGPHLHLFTRKMMQTAPHSVEDLSQEIWLAIYKGLPGLRDAGKFRPWAFRIARDRIFREYRRRKIAFQPLEEDRLEDLAAPGGDDANVDLEGLHRGLEALSPAHREVLVLCFFEEMTYEEIAGVTGSTLGTVRSRIHYAKRALRNALERKPT
jgi:RNA polymerase sigma-70 factor (ECF subfamily)